MPNDQQTQDDSTSGASNCSPCRERIAFEPHWPSGLESRTFYEIPCDDDGHELSASLSVMVADDGDVHVSMSKFYDNPRTDRNAKMCPIPSVRIRTLAGGGKNIRTRQALLWLAEAIRLDNIDNPGNEIR